MKVIIGSFFLAFLAHVAIVIVALQFSAITRTTIMEFFYGVDHLVYWQVASAILCVVWFGSYFIEKASAIRPSTIFMVLFAFGGWVITLLWNMPLGKSMDLIVR